MNLPQFRNYALRLQVIFGFIFLLQLSVEAQSASDVPPSYDQVHRLTEQGKFDDALAGLKEIAKSNPTAKNLSHEFGVTYYRKGDYGNAVAPLQRAIVENPDDKEATQLIGLSLYLSNKPAEAIPYLVKVQSWYPSADLDASYILGVAYIQTKDYASARRAFAKMFQVGPDSAAAYLFTARLLLRLRFSSRGGGIRQKSGRARCQAAVGSPGIGGALFV